MNEIAPLSQLESLERLRVSRTGISDLTPVESCPLSSLQASGNSISDVSPLLGKEMVTVDLQDNAIVSLPEGFAPLRSAEYPAECATLLLSDNDLDATALTSTLPATCNASSGNFAITWDGGSCGGCQSLR